MIYLLKRSSINDVFLKGEGGEVKNVGIYLVKSLQKRKEGGQKIRKNRLTWFMDEPYVAYILPKLQTSIDGP